MVTALRRAAHLEAAVHARRLCCGTATMPTGSLCSPVRMGGANSLNRACLAARLVQLDYLLWLVSICANGTPGACDEVDCTALCLRYMEKQALSLSTNTLDPRALDNVSKMGQGLEE